MIEVLMYTDGSSLGNPGEGGYGAIIEYTMKYPSGVITEKYVELMEGYKHTTNNRMEILGVIKGIEWVNENIGEPCKIHVISDSQYVVNTFQKKWIDKWIKDDWTHKVFDRKTKTSKVEPIKNSDLWKRLIEAKKDHEVDFMWVQGHLNTAGNIRADELAVAAAYQDEELLLDDDGYELVETYKKK